MQLCMFFGYFSEIVKIVSKFFVNEFKKYYDITVNLKNRFEIAIPLSEMEDYYV